MTALYILAGVATVFVITVIIVMVALRPFGKSIEEEEKKREQFRHP